MSTTTGSRRRAEHLGPERRRPQVLDAALEIAARDGLAAVTIGTVADRLQVTRPVIYSCFPDRVALITELLDRETEKMMTYVLTSLHNAHGEDPERAFIIGVQGLLAAVNERADTWQLLFSGITDPEVVHRVQGARTTLAKQAEDWIRPALIRWWDMQDLDRKLPMLMELFVSACEAAVRTMLADRPDDAGPEWRGDSDRIGEFYGSAIHRAFHGA
ncbi:MULTISPECIES: TetR/AcrR family transcriptional regulator [Tsukamurella]|uniref:TetR/AcrR family transcriptional regulator n=1 Tax=Tsukamurella strandjordii TaxID=147577 RepID=A0AA90SQW4_9ACTN|nr:MULTISPECIES: TetR/AcrR family transcriptional regulator [Tsukamurella]MDP0398331.1 TetR/AcrR family transcriptional regulator [Tsukamurella strandjordii]